MEVSWLRLDKREIHFPKEDSAKNREEWDVAIRDRTARALDRWLEQRANKTKYDNRDAVWLNRQGNRYGSSTLNYFLDNLLEETDIDQENRKLVWYSFRHSTGQYVHSQSDDLTTATVLRQKDTKSVSRYASPTPEERRGILENIDG